MLKSNYYTEKEATEIYAGYSKLVNKEYFFSEDDKATLKEILLIEVKRKQFDVLFAFNNGECISAHSFELLNPKNS